MPGDDVGQQHYEETQSKLQKGLQSAGRRVQERALRGAKQRVRKAAQKAAKSAAKNALKAAAKSTLGAAVKAAVGSVLGYIGWPVILVVVGLFLLIYITQMFGTVQNPSQIGTPYASTTKNTAWDQTQMKRVSEVTTYWQDQLSKSQQNDQNFTTWLPSAALVEAIIHEAAPTAGLTAKSIPAVESAMQTHFSNIGSYTLTTTVTTVVSPAHLPGTGPQPPSETKTVVQAPTVIENWSGTHTISWAVVTEAPQTSHTTRQVKVNINAGTHAAPPQWVTYTEQVTTTSVTQTLHEAKVGWKEDFSEFAAGIKAANSVEKHYPKVGGASEEEQVLEDAIAFSGYPASMTPEWGGMTDQGKRINPLGGKGPDGMTWPIRSHYVMIYYGGRINPLNGSIDYGLTDYFSQAVGQPVKAPFKGRVTVLDNDEFGLGVMLKPVSKGNPFSMSIGSMSSVAVHTGEVVQQGEAIGTTGASGSLGKFLANPVTEIALYYNGSPIDPLFAWEGDLTTAIEEGNAASLQLWVPSDGGVAPEPFPPGGDPGCATKAVGGSETFDGREGLGGIPQACVQQIALAAGQKFSVSPFLLLAVADWESNFYRDALAYEAIQGPDGTMERAVGMMQFEPSTWTEYASASGNPSPTPFDPQDATFAAAHMLANDHATTNPYEALMIYSGTNPQEATGVQLLAEWYQTYFGGQLSSTNGGANGG